MSNGRELEICIDAPESARAAVIGGADRVELCGNLPDGGTTPSVGTIRTVRKIFDGGLMVIIRPRGGDFLYDEDEIAEMFEDIRAAREAGADGVVIGCLTADGTVDQELCARLVESAGPLDVTFHRAFDMSRDLDEALETLVSLGVGRILTSGGMPDVPQGVGRIAELVRLAAGRVSLMPGGGVVPENIGELVVATGVNEVHLSARTERESAMRFRNEECSMGAFTDGREYKLKFADPDKVRASREALDGAGV